jgi:queuosine precursor transporter
MVLSDWIGLVWIVGAICFCFASVGIGIIVAEMFGREHAVLWIVGLQCAFQILISFTSAQFVGLTIAGVTFITIAGSLIYPTIELGANYLNEFYGLKISRTSVNAQLVCRVVTSIVLGFLFLLPSATGYEQNHSEFLNLNKIVPRIAAASIFATWITGLVMVYVYDAVRARTGDGMLWLRAVCANVVSMFVNSLLFVIAAFAFVLPIHILVNMVAVQILFKFIDSFLELGFLYGLREMKARGLLIHNGTELAAPASAT